MAKLHFYYSAMNAGKSTMLLQSSYNYNERGMHTLVFTPAIDDRYGGNKISTRIGLEKEAISVPEDFDLFDHAHNALKADPKLRCILVDEAQFLTRQQILQLCRICDELGIPVLAYGIRSDFKAEPFPGSLQLLTLADEIIEIKTICHCGRKATMNMRVDAQGRAVHEGEQVAIGGNELYVATCRRHFFTGESQ